MKKLLNQCILLLLLVLLFNSCSQQTPLEGFYAGSLRFSPVESMQSRLLLRADSSFVYLSQPNEGADWLAYSGSWSMQEDKLLLQAGRTFQLWLHAEANKLEVLDYAGQRVIGDKRLELLKTQNLPSDTIQFIASGELILDEDAGHFRFCGSRDAYAVSMNINNLDFAFGLYVIQATFPDTLYMQARFALDHFENFGAESNPLRLIDYLKEENPCP